MERLRCRDIDGLPSCRGRVRANEKGATGRGSSGSTVCSGVEVSIEKMGETRRNPSFIVSRTPPSQIRNFQLQNLAIVFHHPKMRRGGIGHRLVAGQSMNVYVDATINASPILKLLSSLEHVVNVGHIDRFPWASTTSSVYPQHRGTQRVGLPSRGGDVVIMLVPLGECRSTY